MVKQARPLAGAIVAVCLPLYMLWFFHRPAWLQNIGYDEQYFVWTGWSILKGLVPYVDFMEYKPPVIFFMHAVALELFGFEGFAYRQFFLLLLMAAFGALTLSLFSRGVNRTIACAAVCSAIYLFSDWAYHDTSFADVESVGYAFYMFAVACLLARTPWRNVMDTLGGAFLALCFFSKEPFGPVIGATWFSSFLINGTVPFRQAFKRYAKFTFLGAFIVVGALMSYLAMKGGLRAYAEAVSSYRDLFRDPAKSYCVLLGNFRPTGSLVADLPAQFEKIHHAFFNYKTLGFLWALIGVGIPRLWARARLLLAMTLVTVACGLYAATFSHCYFGHYYVMAQTGVCFCLFVAADSFSSASLQPWLRRGLLAVVALTIAIPVGSRWLAQQRALRGTRIVAPPVLEPLPGISDFVARNSQPTDKIFTSGPPLLYVLTNRLHGSRYSAYIDEVLATLPGTTDEERLADRRANLVRSMPKIMVLDPEHGPRKSRHNAALFMPFIREFNYQQVGPHYFVRP
jgi:hypothetical protein